MQLSEKNDAVVRATVEVLAAHADEVTRVFYPSLFEAAPELLRMFNRANQAIGEQPRALAGAVVAFAALLVNPDAPDFSPVMRRIAHKHVSLGVKPREYAIVGHHLLGAVGEVLGDAVTPEVYIAWDEVYWLFASMLIAEEAKLYALGGTDPEQPWRKYRVVERFDEAEDVISLLLSPIEGTVPDHRTGQYVAIAVDLPDGSRQPRQYTISSGPRGDALRVTVKRVRGAGGTPDGQVSGWLHDHAIPGAVLDVSQPAGDVILEDSDAPLVLVSAGIGITPIAAILEDISRRQPHRTVRLFHADRAHDNHALYPSLRRQVLAMEDARAQNWYQSGAESAPTLHPALAGYMDLSAVELPDDAVVFMCGPLAFMQSARQTLIERGVPADRINYEIFGPDLWATSS